MVQKLKRSWQRFRRSKPGQRFTERYHQRQKSGRSPFRKVLVMTAGVLLAILGVVLLVAPGPGLIVLVIGASLIAEESLFAARFLDWMELRLRRIYASWRRLWSHTSPAIKVALVLVVLVIVAALAFGAYRVAFAA